MKKILLSALLLFCLSGLFAQNYPVIMNNGTILVNTGVGFGGPIKTQMQCPPLTVSFDAALPIAGLPLTVGIITGYFSEKPFRETEYNFWPIAGRIAYHPGFKVSRLDTYALLTLGSVIIINEPKNQFWFGLGAGGRYFFHPYIGAYLEFGFGHVQNIGFGLSFKI